VVIGVTSILSGIAGKFSLAHLREPGLTIQRGHSLGTIESLKFVGPVPSPVSGIIVEANGIVVRNPKVLNDSPYDGGWVARLRPSDFEGEKGLLFHVGNAERELRAKIGQFHVRCFKAFPDHEMVELGVECSAVLLKLKELVEQIPPAAVVHLVSDDPTAYVEMVRWTDETSNSLVDWRQEGDLFHFIIRKTR
jgi:glycine cleavage system H protein